MVKLGLVSSEARQPVWAEAGDVFFARGSGLLERAIQLAEKDAGEKAESWANHMGVVVGAGWLVPPPQQEDDRSQLATTVEALWTVERCRWWTRHRKEYEEEGYRVRAFGRTVPATVDQVVAVINRALTYVGDKYGWWKLGFHLADRVLFGGKKVLSGLMFLDSRPICSYLAAHACDAAGWRFGADPDAVDPDLAMDWCLAHPGEWAERGPAVV